MQTTAQGLDTQVQIDRLTVQHKALKMRLKQLDKQLSLTSAERVERTQLKKLKLLTKDRIHTLRHHSPTQPMST